MTTAPTPEEVRALAARLEHCVAKWGKQNALSLEAYSAVKMMRRLQVENDLLREKADRLPADWESDSSLETWFPLTAGRLAELEARKPLPLSDEQIDSAADKIDNDQAFLCGFHEGARFAERAHGIT